MPKDEYAGFEALNPFFEIVKEGLRGLVDGGHYFDTIAADALFEFRYTIPGWLWRFEGEPIWWPASLIMARASDFIPATHLSSTAHRIVAS
jgi:hypothetical protein